MMLPKDWIAVKIPRGSSNEDSQLAFIDMKSNLISLHPPFSLNKIEDFKEVYGLEFDTEDLITSLRNRLRRNENEEGSKQVQKVFPKVAKKLEEQEKKSEFEIQSKTVCARTVSSQSESVKSNLRDVNYLIKLVKDFFNCQPNFSYAELGSESFSCCIKTTKNHIIFEASNCKTKKIAKDTAVEGAIKVLQSQSSPTDKSNINVIEEKKPDLPKKATIDEKFLGKKKEPTNFDQTVSIDLQDGLKKQKKNDNDTEKPPYFFSSKEEEEKFRELKLDDLEVINVYLKNSKYSPYTIYTKFKNENVNKLKEFDLDLLDYEDGNINDIGEKSKYHKYVIEFPERNMCFEGFAISKTLAKEFAAQKLLKVIYPQFTYWIELIDHMERMRINRKERRSFHD